MYNIDFTNRDTIKKTEGARIVNDLTKALETLRKDPSYNAINAKLPGKAQVCVVFPMQCSANQMEE